MFYGDKVDYYTSTTTTGYSNSDSATIEMKQNNTITVNAKPTAYSFVISQSSTGVSVIYTTITRGTIGKTYAGASDITQSMNQTFTCYYGDTYSITANVNTGYTTGSANTSGTITGNKTLTLAATPTVYKLTLTKGTGANTLYYKITKRGNCAPSGSATHTTWQTYSSAVNIYYGDTVAYYAGGKTGYSNTSESTATVSGNITQTLTCTAKTVTLAVPYGTTWSFKVTVTRGAVAKEQGKSNETFNGSAGGGMKAFTCYYGDTYSVDFTPTASGKWARKASGTIYSSGVTVSSPSIYTKPTITFAPQTVEITYNSANKAVYIDPRTNATVTIPADNPALKITRYLDVTLYNQSDSEIDYISHSFSDTSVSDTSSAQTKNLPMYATIVGSRSADYGEIDYGEVYMDITVYDSSTGQMVVSVSRSEEDYSPTSDSQIE